MNDSTNTLALEGFTPYAQVPRWVLRSGKRLSVGARALYGIIMTYASNDARTAFPTRETLAEDLGVSVRSVSTYTKELEEFGAPRVERRRNKRTGSFYANHYTLVFTDPCAADCTRPGAESDTITRPTISTTPTTPSLRSPSPLRDECASSLRSPSLSERRSERPLIEAIRDIARAQPGDEYEAAVGAFTDRFEETHGVEAPQWEDGWGASLARCVKDLGTARGTSKLLGVYTNTAYSP